MSLLPNTVNGNIRIPGTFVIVDTDGRDVETHREALYVFEDGMGDVARENGEFIEATLRAIEFLSKVKKINNLKIRNLTYL